MRLSLNGLLLCIGAVIATIALLASWRGPDCDSGTTDSYSPDLRQDQLRYLDDYFPEDFEDRVHADEQLLQLLRVADSAANAGKRRMFLDVGANRGSFSFAVLENWGEQDERDHVLRLQHVGEDAPLSVHESVKEPKIVAFEVAAARVKTLEKLAARVPGDALEVHRIAMTDEESCGDAGSVTISQGPFGPSLGKGDAVDRVDCSTVDRWLIAHQDRIDRICVARVHVNGFEAPVVRGMINALTNDKVEQLIFDYSHKWQAEYTGLAKDESLRALVDELDALDIDCYMIAKRRLIKLGDGYWDDRFELYKQFKYISVDVWCIKTDNPARRRLLDFFNEPYEIDDPFD